MVKSLKRDNPQRSSHIEGERSQTIESDKAAGMLREASRVEKSKERTSFRRKYSR
jgi:hypothetical protein